MTLYVHNDVIRTAGYGWWLVILLKESLGEVEESSIEDSCAVISVIPQWNKQTVLYMIVLTCSLSGCIMLFK
jgi:hypothetical protein